MYLMRILFYFSIVCASSLLVTGLLLCVEEYGTTVDTLGQIMLVVFFMTALMQFIYSFLNWRMSKYRVPVNSHSLDDDAMNQLWGNEWTVRNNFWMKSICVLCSLFWIAQFAWVAFMFQFLWDELRGFDRQEPEDWALIFFLITFLTALPTVLYNLRTFNIERIRHNTP
ncbi:MAG: hypothetical protein ACKVOR_11610 [Flavobacteriales bacterium]